MSTWRSRIGRARSARAPAAFIDPCLPTQATKPPSADGWAHEIKHDGFRLQIHIRDGRVHLYTITGYDWTDRYPRIVKSAGKLKGSAIIDAEAVVQNADGVADFEALMSRTRDAEAVAFCFDLLMADGEDLRPRPFAERKALLSNRLRRAKTGLHYVEHIEFDGALIFEHACTMGLEGIVSKKLAAPYRSGRSKTWLKIKNPAAPGVLRFAEE